MRYSRESSTKRGYDIRWQRARETFLFHNPLCAECGKHGKTSAATVVDHIAPHRGNPGLFWDRSNWQALCKHCHDSHKQRAERSGKSIGCDENGNPLDSNHHWHR